MPHENRIGKLKTETASRDELAVRVQKIQNN